MCGRFTLTRPAREVADFLDADVPELFPRYNIAPTQPVLALRAGGPAMLRWGLVPPWSADLSVAPRMLNARADTVAAKPSYRAAFARRRCLIVADGFYEWRAEGKKKLPVHFRLPAGLFAIAGIWERWREVETVALLTTEANEVVRPVHDRMPVIVPREAWAAWLADGPLVNAWPWGVGPAEAVEANPWVNNARNEGPACWTREAG